MEGVLAPPQEDGWYGRSPLDYREDQPTLLKVSSSPLGNFGKHEHQMGGLYAKTDSSLVAGPRERWKMLDLKTKYKTTSLDALDSFG